MNLDDECLKTSDVFIPFLTLNLIVVTITYSLKFINRCRFWVNEE